MSIAVHRSMVDIATHLLVKLSVYKDGTGCSFTYGRSNPSAGQLIHKGRKP